MRIEQDRRKRFAVGVSEKINRIIQLLHGFNDNNREAHDEIVNDLQAVKAASRDAGFGHISDLCQQMENCLADLPIPAQSSRETAALLAGCQYIRLFADSLKRGIVPPAIPVTLMLRLPERKASTG